MVLCCSSLNANRTLVTQGAPGLGINPFLLGLFLQWIYCDFSFMSFICSSMKAKLDATLFPPPPRLKEARLDLSHCGDRFVPKPLSLLARGSGTCSAAGNKAKHRELHTAAYLSLQVVCGVNVHTSVVDPLPRAGHVKPPTNGDSTVVSRADATTSTVLKAGESDFSSPLRSNPKYSPGAWFSTSCPQPATLMTTV